MIGDSMIAGALGLFLARGLRDLHGYDVHRRGKSSSGLARPDFFNWTKEATRLLEKEFPDPDAVVMMVGGNDAQGLRMPKKTWIRWHEPGWSEEYARRVAAFAEHVAPNGRHLFWIGMPVMRPPKFHERMKRVNTIYRAEMAIRPNAHFIDIWRVLADEEGNYADRLKLHGGKKVRVRVGDGIHLSGAGARHAEAHIRAIIHRTLLAAGVTAARAPA